jgi:hypothetical protein
LTRDARKGANESWFRDVNERLEHRASGTAAVGDSFEIVCECEREECTERIAITFAEYESVRTDARTFIVRPGHTDTTCERIVASHDAYNVVKKSGEAGVTAEVENPRNGNNPEDQPD